MCRKLRGKFGDQKMSDLPKERCQAAPFTHCGVDMFGPFIIREREGPVLNDIVPYLPVLQVEQYISR